jgi:predicted aspartyl protease
MRSACAIAGAVGVLLASTTAEAGDVPEDAVVAKLPFLAVAEPNRIFVDLAPEGSPPLQLMLDTGAADSVFTPLAARRAGIPVRRNKQSPYRRETLAGRDLQFWVDTSTSDTGSKTGWEYGVLGGGFLAKYVVEFDFTTRNVRLLDPKRFSVPASAQEPEHFVGKIGASTRPVLDIEIDGHPLRVLVDTGCPNPVVLSGKAARAAGIDVDALPEFGTAMTMMGPMPLRFFEASELKIGPFVFRNVPVEVAPKGWYGMAGETNDSVIGYDLISRFLVRIDYPEKRIWLRRESDAVSYLGVDYAMTRASGAFLSPWPGLYRVDAVLPGTPAARLGLRMGDLVEKRPGAKTPEAVLQSIRAGEALKVMREEDGVMADVHLEPQKAAASH